MSAMNYNECPRCRVRAEDERSAALLKVEQMYGVAPMAEYEAAKAAVPVIAKRPLTLREDWEITGASSGTVVISYYTSCEACGLKASFTDRHPLDPPALTAGPEHICAWYVGSEDDEEGPRECGEVSRYLVERSDGNEDYGEHGGSAEACHGHLADVSLSMIDGDEDVRAVITVRWSEDGW